MTATVAMIDGSMSRLSDDVLEALQMQLRGPLVGPGDPGFEPEPRPSWNAMHSDRPGLAVRPTGTADVVDAVNFARDNGLLVAVRGGGHSVAGLSTVRDGLLIDLSGMRGVLVDPERRVVHVQGGAVLGDMDRETQAFGLATPGGRISDTGVAGLTLGGGIGWLNNKYGLACDNLVEAQVVCADGQVRTASAESNPDLFWAIRGGGGNFGIVTEFTFRLHPLGPIVAFAVTFYPIEEATALLRGWRDYALGAPDEVTSIAAMITFPAAPGMPEVIHDRPVVILGGLYAGGPGEGMSVLQPLREMGTVLFDMSQPMPYTMAQTGLDPLFPRDVLRSYWKAQYLDEFSDDATAAVARLAQNRPAPMTMVNMFHLGGAVHAVGPEDTAFAERSAPFMVSFDGNWSDAAQDAEAVGWVRSAWDGMRKYGNGAVYLNFAGRADEPVREGVDSAFGRNLRRLAAIKAQYDPTNFFQTNNNIVP
jgi:FAD/FMN-containing dehydrogenase